MALNYLHKLKIRIEANDYTPARTLMDKLHDVSDMVYSYFITMHLDKSNVIKYYMITVNLSESDDYNTIPMAKAIVDIVRILNNQPYHLIHGMIGFGQPLLDVVIKASKPLVSHLATIQHEHWTSIEYDDLCQICYMSIIKLYNKHKFIHKELIRRTFYNDVLMSLRHDKNKPQMISIEGTSSVSEDGSYVTIIDQLVDDTAESEVYQQYDEEYEKHILKQQMDYIIDCIGQRKFDQLLFEYGHKCTTPSGIKLMNKLRKMVLEEGITNKSFRR